MNCTSYIGQWWAREPDPEVVWAEAEDIVAKYGPDADLKELFG